MAQGYDDLVTQIIKYEQGEMDEDEWIAFFQQLIDNGLAWSLQGHYGRTAHSLIEAGYCTAPGTCKVCGSGLDDIKGQCTVDPHHGIKVEERS